VRFRTALPALGLAAVLAGAALAQTYPAATDAPQTTDVARLRALAVEREIHERFARGLSAVSEEKMAQSVPYVPGAEAVVTSLPPRFDEDGALRWQERFRQHLAEGQMVHIIDVDAVDLLSATMLGFLIAVLRMVRDRGGAVGLVATRENALRTLGVTGLDRVFSVGRTIAEVAALMDARAGAGAVQESATNARKTEGMKG
jgi:anti-anti-sigma factor